MSHFALLVITPNGTPEEAEELLKPFDENLSVEPYTKPCWCLGTLAKIRVQDQLDKEFPLKELQFEFHSRKDIRDATEESKLAGNFGFSSYIDDEWDKFYEHPRQMRRRDLMGEQPDQNQVDPNCIDCCGSGVEQSTYNPNSKWDWYRIGGKWSEMVHGWQQITAGEFVTKIVDDEPFRTFAVLTPDGWFEKSKLYGRYDACDENPEWPAIYDDLLRKYKDMRVLVYDCHI